MRTRSSNRTVTGLDIEPGFVAAVEARVNGSLAVERSATHELAPGVIAAGEVADVDALAAALRELFADSGLSKRVRVGVANSRVAVRTLDLPPITDRKDLDAAVRFQAADELPIPADEAVLDYHSLGVIDTPNGPRTRVVAVAAQRTMVTRLLAALRAAGLRPEGIDLSAFAMIRALHHPSPVDGSLTLYVNVGGLTNIALARGTTCVFTRVAPTGIEALNRDLEVAAHRIADEARNAFEFYATQEAGAVVGLVSVSGRAVGVPGFVEAFERSLGLDAVLEVGSVPGVEAGSLDGAAGSAMAIAAGLAIEEHVA